MKKGVTYSSKDFQDLTSIKKYFLSHKTARAFRKTYISWKLVDRDYLMTRKFKLISRNLFFVRENRNHQKNKTEYSKVQSFEVS